MHLFPPSSPVLPFAMLSHGQPWQHPQALSYQGRWVYRLLVLLLLGQLYACTRLLVHLLTKQVQQFKLINHQKFVRYAKEMRWSTILPSDQRTPEAISCSNKTWHMVNARSQGNRAAPYTPIKWSIRSMLGAELRLPVARSRPSTRMFSLGAEVFPTRRTVLF